MVNKLPNSICFNFLEQESLHSSCLVEAHWSTAATAGLGTFASDIAVQTLSGKSMDPMAGSQAKRRTLKAQTPFENTQAIWEWADTTWRKSPILGGRSECSDTVAWKLICLWTLDVVNECKWRIQGRWGLCWEHFQLSHSRALSWAVFLFWQVKKQMSPASTSRI